MAETEECTSSSHNYDTSRRECCVTWYLEQKSPRWEVVGSKNPGLPQRRLSGKRALTIIVKQRQRDEYVL